jgi:LuxR family maltose regulon positive regulatory protein
VELQQGVARVQRVGGPDYATLRAKKGLSIRLLLYNRPMPILATKLFIPSLGSKVVLRPRLIERLNEGLESKLILISAPAGFGKTTLAAEWIAGSGRRAAWLSLDEGESDITRFLLYLIAALQTIDAKIGKTGSAALRAPQPPSAESILTTLLNEIAGVPEGIVLVLDDYHLADAAAIDRAMAFLLERLPPRMHMVIATREDPNLPLARLRAQGQLAELRAADLRFDASETAEFLDTGIGLPLSADAVAALENRTEGWIAGLQLAAISLRGHPDAAGFISSFTGSHRFVLDYLLEEVLRRQPESIQSFLLHTSILSRMCGPLCDAVMGDASAPGSETLEYLERANMFIVPLDHQRRWYRYHHLFADALRQRLQQSLALSAGNGAGGAAELHVRASAWYEENGLEIEAFHHAAAAHDFTRAERLIEGKGMPLYFRGALIPVLNWLKSLPAEVLDARPSLWTAYASATLATGQAKDATEQLRAAESALEGATLDRKTRDVVGRIAAIRATLAVGRHEPDAIIAQSRRALEYLDPANLAYRTSTAWKMGIAYRLQGDLSAAGRAYAEVLSASQASGNTVFTLLALAGLGDIQEVENELRLAVTSYRSVLDLAGDVPFPYATLDANLGLARIYYEWNDLDAALRHWRQSVPLAQRIESMGRFVACDLLLARLKLAQGGIAEAAALLSKADEAVARHAFTQYTSEIAAARVMIMIRQGDLVAAGQLAEAHGLPISLARVHLARGDPSAALAVLEPFRRQAEEKGQQDHRLKAMVLQALAHQANGEKEEALRSLGEALALAEPNGFLRTFIDEGSPMAGLLVEAAAQGIMPDYAAALLDGLRAGERRDKEPSRAPGGLLVEALTRRELEVLQLVAQGLSNEKIGERLFLSLSTVKGHNRKIFDKLQVQRRTEAVARARELRLL